MTVAPPFQLHPAQGIVAKDMHRFRVLCCGRRFGKTALVLDQMKARACIPNSRIAYIAPTFQQARDIAWNQLKKECEQSAKSINEARLEIILINGSMIILRGWEAVETLRGQFFHLVVIDEVASMRDFTFQWQEVVRPTLTDYKGEAIFCSTPKGYNHFYELYMREFGYEATPADPEFKSYHFTSYDNPHLDPEELNKARNSMTSERFSQEYLAEFTKTEGLVYKEFNRQEHIFTSDSEQYVETIVGVDFGFTHPCAVLTVKRDRADGLWLTSEWYERGHTDIEIAEYASSIRANRYYPDPESPGAIVELKKRASNVREVIKGKDSVKNGINRVREYLKAGKLHIHASCVNTIREFETYSYPDKKPGHAEYENPIKDGDDAMDALRYVVMMAGKSTESSGYHDPGFGQLRPKFTANLARISTGVKNYSKTYGKNTVLADVRAKK